MEASLLCMARAKPAQLFTKLFFVRNRLDDGDRHTASHRSVAS
jgi:hypothetical protein